MCSHLHNINCIFFITFQKLKLQIKLAYDAYDASSVAAITVLIVSCFSPPFSSTSPSSLLFAFFFYFFLGHTLTIIALLALLHSYVLMLTLLEFYKTELSIPCTS